MGEDSDMAKTITLLPSIKDEATKEARQHVDDPRKLLFRNDAS